MLEPNLTQPSLGAILQAVWSHRIVMILSLFLGIVLSSTLYFVFTPVFEASSLVLVQPSPDDHSTDGSRQIELVNSAVRVAESWEVIESAVDRVGLDNFQSVKPSKIDGLGGWLRQKLSFGGVNSPVTVSDAAVIANRVARLISVNAEPNSDVIKISVKNSNPVLAAQFSNAIANAFVERETTLSEKPGAVDFFQRQRKQFEEEVGRRYASLELYRASDSIYSVEEERNLLLRRESELAGMLSGTRMSLVEKRGRKASLVAQLKLLKPVTRSPFVSTVVETLGGGVAADDASHAKPDAPHPKDERASGSGDPPLLMVRVYQDSMVELFKLNSEIAGLEELVQQQQQEMGKVRGELASLAEHEPKFEQLKRDVALATYNADYFAKRAVEEQVNTDLRHAKLTNYRIIQQAAVPLQAAFPKGAQFLAFGAFAGLILGLTLSVSDKGPTPGQLSAFRRRLSALRPAAFKRPDATTTPRDRRKTGTPPITPSSDLLEDRGVVEAAGALADNQSFL